MSAASGPEICAGLQGGLGNQLFQYAAARGLAARTGGRVSVHMRNRAAAGIRTAGLGELGLTPPERASMTGLARAVRNLAKLAGADAVKTPAGWRGAVFQEAAYAYDPRIEGVTGDTYLAGFFQSPRYFAHVAEDLRRDLIPDPARRDAISVHVRRGDYLALADAHAPLDADYYTRALAAVRALVGDAPALLFSDDLPAAAEMLNGMAQPVDTGSRASDLRAMAACRHHVIANSTFSWWGAWLGPGGVTAAPETWFGPSGPSDTQDLIPEGWIRV